VALILQSEHQAYDAILLDVDNGPDGFTRKGNDWLYTDAGASTAYGALQPAGVLAVCRRVVTLPSVIAYARPVLSLMRSLCGDEAQPAAAATPYGSPSAAEYPTMKFRRTNREETL